MSRSVEHTILPLSCAFILMLSACDSSTPDDSATYPVTPMAGTTGATGGAAGFGNAGTNGGVFGGMSGGTAGMSGAGGLGGAGGQIVGNTGGTGGAGGMGGQTGGTGGAGGMGGQTGGTGGAGGMSMDSGGTGGGEPGMSVSGIPDEELAMLRQVCVDEINMYRATLSLAPIARADADQELCSDQGAKMDGDSQQAHGSAGTSNPCNETMRWGAFPYFGAQNTCPNWPVGGGFGGFATIADALKNCLEGMWDEGEPPQGTEACIEEYRNGDTECFLAHGHYINMKGDGMGVSCGFYKTSSGKYWMNQDFY